ncbi:hypothetical protein FB446DRAFT_722068 [Lentinula raphanica]|nr:hypothetical protein FB446DRAFT_722068 [Lentinula raphanica]
MSSHFGLAGKPFSTSPNSVYPFDFGHNHLSSPPDERWQNIPRSHRSDQSTLSSSRRSWPVRTLDPSPSSNPSSSHFSTKHPSRVLNDPRGSNSSAFSTNDSFAFGSPSSSQTSSPQWDSSISSPSSAVSTSHAFPSHSVKKEEPDSPKFIIEPLLPSSLVTKRSSSSSPEPCSSPTQAELESQLLLSQALAPPTEVPLRATQACDDMRKMMRSFRLNPFSILTSNTKDSKSDAGACSDLDPVVTWCGEIAQPLEEEPLIFEWQLDDYKSGLEGDLPELIVMNDVEDCESGVEHSNTLEANLGLGEDPEAPLIFSPSLLSSEVASKSGFLTQAETDSQRVTHIGTLSTLPRMPFFPEYGPKNGEMKARANSYDSGYESNNSVLTHPLRSSQNLRNSLQRRSFDQGLQKQSADIPVHNKPRFGIFPDSNPSRSPSITSYDHEIAFRSEAFYEPSNFELTDARGADNIDIYASARSSKVMPHSKGSLKNDINSGHAASGSMYISTLLNVDSNPSSSPYSPNYQSTRVPPPKPRVSSTRSRMQASTSSNYRQTHPGPISQDVDVMNVARIWANAANPPPDSDSELEYRGFDRRLGDQHQGQHYPNGPSMPEMSSGSGSVVPSMQTHASASQLSPLCYLGQQQQEMGHGHVPPGQIRIQSQSNGLVDMVTSSMRSTEGPAQAASLYALARGAVAFHAST